VVPSGSYRRFLGGRGRPHEQRPLLKAEFALKCIDLFEKKGKKLP